MQVIKTNSLLGVVPWNEDFVGYGTCLFFCLVWDDTEEATIAPSAFQNLKLPLRNFETSPKVKM